MKDRLTQAGILVMILALVMASFLMADKDITPLPQKTVALWVKVDWNTGDVVAALLGPDDQFRERFPDCPPICDDEEGIYIPDAELMDAEWSDIFRSIEPGQVIRQFVITEKTLLESLRPGINL